ncbi:EmrB/QacA subfamily drug resistance transporter [Pusillimonas noertemannii]|uniref:EmrB/QacA subfamily drug resistance transporter n=2 Tax=Pusillimonas noertemannii TaxID=305977 RepID=A0A2U1CRQ4_9BURK|nr:EmrB/QacA subfamily drug resistance transporter [Pusillimonas noertemannii]
MWQFLHDDTMNENAAPETQPDAPVQASTVAHRRWILAALMLTIALAAMDITIVATAVPQIVGDLGGFERFSWLFSIYLLAQTVTIPIYGKLADLYGRKPVLLAGTALFLAGSAACAAAWGMIPLIVFRGIQGLGAGSIMATVNTLAGDLYSTRERARIQGWLSSVWGIAAILGPTLGGAFAEYATWRWVFLINLPIGLAAMGLIARFLNEQAPVRHHIIDYPGAILMMMAGSAGVFGLLQGGNAWGWLSAPSLITFAVVLILVVATVVRERTAAEPIMPGWVWRHRVMLGSNLAMVGMGLVMMAPGAYLPVFAQAVLGLGPIAAGLVLASMSAGWVTAASWSGHLYLRIGFRDTALLGAALMFAGVVGFILLPDSPSYWLVVADQVLLGAGFGMLSTPLLVGVQSIVPWNQRGVATSTNMWSRYLGQSLGAAIAGAIFNGAMRSQLQDAPASLAGTLPEVNAVVGALQSGSLGSDGTRFLQSAFDAATHHVYLGMAWAAALTILLVLLVPRRPQENMGGS